MFPRNSRGRRHRNTQLMLIIFVLHTLLTCLWKLEIAIPPATLRRPSPVLAVVVEVKVFFITFIIINWIITMIKLLSVTDDNFNFPRTGICTEYSLTFLNGIIWGLSLFMQTPCLSEHVRNIIAVGISFNTVDPLMLIAYKAFSVSFYGGRRLQCSLLRRRF